MSGPRVDLDLDLHGVAGIRLVDATADEIAAVERQVGPLPRRPSPGPVVTVRFVDRLASAGTLRILGAREAGWDDEGFLVLRSRRLPVRMRYPIERLGGPCELVLERGAPAVPLLVATLNMAILGSGTLPLHASAFELDGRGVLATGWSKGGKTELLMGAVELGARYIGDEWVYVRPDGGLVGIPEPVRLWDWQLAQLPAVRERIGRGERLRLSMLPWPGRVDRVLPRRLRRLGPARLVHRTVPLVENQRHVDLDPAVLFPDHGAPISRLDHVFLVVATDDPTIRVEPIGAEEVADRIVHSLLHERLDVEALYRHARYARPDLVNPFLEDLGPRQHRLAVERLADRPAHRIDHPYPVDLRTLARAARSVL